jgi:glycogen(starch) synthase
VRFSLIVCSRNRPESLARTLLGVAQLRYRAFELIIISDPADPATAETLDRHAPAARLGYCAAANLAQARNIGLAMARGDIVAFLDDDAVPEPDWLDQLATAYGRPQITAAGGFIRDRNGIKFQSRIVLIDEFGADHHRPAVTQPPAGGFLSLTGTNFSVRREAALALGGFDENYAYFLEETDFLLRLQQAGGQIAVIAGAEIHHGYAPSAVRKHNGAPKSLAAIARSKAYFCHINRRPETAPETLETLLQKFVRRKTRQLWTHLLLGRLRAGEIAPLLGELQTGIRDGKVLAKKPRVVPPLAAASGEFLPYQSRQQPRQRLCVLMRSPPDAAAWQRLGALAGLDHEVTVLYFGGIRRRVRFSGAIWQHQLPVIWRSPATASQALTRELRRIMPRRRFDKIYVASAGKAFAEAAAATGLPGFAPEDAESRPPTISRT